MRIDFERFQAAIGRDVAVGLKVGANAGGFLLVAAALDKAIGDFLTLKTELFPICNAVAGAAGSLVASALAGRVASKLRMNPKWLARAVSAASIGLAIRSPEKSLLLEGMIFGAFVQVFYFSILSFHLYRIQTERMGVESRCFRMIVRNAIFIGDQFKAVR